MIQKELMIFNLRYLICGLVLSLASFSSVLAVTHFDTLVEAEAESASMAEYFRSLKILSMDRDPQVQSSLVDLRKLFLKQLFNSNVDSRSYANSLAFSKAPEVSAGMLARFAQEHEIFWRGLEMVLAEWKAKYSSSGADSEMNSQKIADLLSEIGRAMQIELTLSYEMSCLFVATNNPLIEANYDNDHGFKFIVPGGKYTLLETRQITKIIEMSRMIDDLKKEGNADVILSWNDMNDLGKDPTSRGTMKGLFEDSYVRKYYLEQTAALARMYSKLRSLVELRTKISYCFRPLRGEGQSVSDSIYRAGNLKQDSLSYKIKRKLIKLNNYAHEIQMFNLDEVEKLKNEFILRFATQDHITRGADEDDGGAVSEKKQNQQNKNYRKKSNKKKNKKKSKCEFASLLEKEVELELETEAQLGAEELNSHTELEMTPTQEPVLALSSESESELSVRVEEKLPESHFNSALQIETESQEFSFVQWVKQEQERSALKKANRMQVCQNSNLAASSQSSSARPQINLTAKSFSVYQSSQKFRAGGAVSIIQFQNFIREIGGEVFKSTGNGSQVRYSLPNYGANRHKKPYLLFRIHLHVGQDEVNPVDLKFFLGLALETAQFDQVELINV